jgi:hypothetical protein
MDTRCLRLTDLFEVKCKRCSSTDVDLISQDCDKCGPTISAECNSCNLKYDYHDFRIVNVTYVKDKEVSNSIDLTKL